MQKGSTGWVYWYTPCLLLRRTYSDKVLFEGVFFEKRLGLKFFDIWGNGYKAVAADDKRPFRAKKEGFFFSEGQMRL